MCPFLNVFDSKKKTEVVHEHPEKMRTKESDFRDWRREKSTYHKREQCCGVLLKIEKSYAAATKDLCIKNVPIVSKTQANL